MNPRARPAARERGRPGRLRAAMARARHGRVSRGPLQLARSRAARRHGPPEPVCCPLFPGHPCPTTSSACDRGTATGKSASWASCGTSIAGRRATNNWCAPRWRAAISCAGSPESTTSRSSTGTCALPCGPTRGPPDFTMRWNQSSAQDFGTRGKVLLDLEDNRFLVPDTEPIAAPRARALATVCLLVSPLARAHRFVGPNSARSHESRTVAHLDNGLADHGLIPS